MQIVRYTTPAEIHRMTVLCKQMYEASGGGFSKHVRVEVPYASRRYTEMVQKGIAVVMALVDKEGEVVGGLGAVKVPDIHTGEPSAVETFWWTHEAHRGHGLLLFKAFERWGKEEGCARLAMIHLEDSMPERLAEFYRRRGYECVERHYVRGVEE